MNPLTPASLSRAAFRDGSLDLCLAAGLLLVGGWGCLGRISVYPLTGGWLLGGLLFEQLRRRVFAPRAGHVRLRAWRMHLPLLVVALLMAGGALGLVFWFKGPIPTGSVWDRPTSELTLGLVAIASLVGAAALGLRRLWVYAGCALLALLAHLKGVPPAAILLGLAGVPLGVGMTLLVRFLKEPVDAEA